MKAFVFVLFIAFFLPLAVFSQNICIADQITAEKSYGADLSQGVYQTSAKWLPGQTLTVKFLDGDNYIQSKVEQYAAEWQDYANIKFQFIQSGQADIRVSFLFQKGASWSLVGKESEDMSMQYVGDKMQSYQGNDGVTMNLGWFTDNTADVEFKRTTLHEFGHALGLLHEHKSADRPFDYNVPVVLNYYENQLHWPEKEVYEQVINKYSSTNAEFSNKKYDPQSIMHYPVPPEFITNPALAVGWNTDLSSGDKALIAEMYPFGNDHSESFAFENIAVQHNFYKNNEKGMQISISFKASTSQTLRHRLSAYFYTSDGEELKDNDNTYNTADGHVSTGQDFTPLSDTSQLQIIDLFIPYTQLDVGCGDFKLKFNVTAWEFTQDDKPVSLSYTGDQYFSYWQCPSVENITAFVQYDQTVDNQLGMKIYPVFTINHAMGTNCTVNAYFYMSDNTPLKDFNGLYKTTDGNVAVTNYINPCCETTYYNNNSKYEYFLFIPYDELHLVKTGKYDLKFYLSVMQGTQDIKQSDWQTFTISY